MEILGAQLKSAAMGGVVGFGGGRGGVVGCGVGGDGTKMEPGDGIDH